MAKTEPKKPRLADYKRPPLIEVVYGVKFAPLKGWKIPHIGAFWQQVAAEFPICEHAPPIGDTDFIDFATSFPMPRVWLINQSDDRLIQLQPGRFLFNWRQRESAKPYPRYKALSKSFLKYFCDFQAFVAAGKLGDLEVVEYELTYINHVIESENWKFPEQMGRVIKQLEWEKQRYSFLPHPSSMTWHARFSIEEHFGRLVAKINPAKRTTDDKELVVIELSARGIPSEAPLDGIEDWFSRAHEWIVRGFEDLTCQEAQTKLWGRYE